ncbi:VOC family protein [Paenarthrobacter sp. PH39-S1]|uniref:VOC family protein n=1 Tax=Paenarthrobacter sp. PH39-S1 TaxID=3046204 RepID=UPI0024B886F6|nr:VOC family protein [Paenarthrobacter sp. PH39-S1]MDJ0358452.1 VOC family protein [Paenarthrobacter sp. PH39-S1]
MKILNVTLTVRDLAAAVKFYRDILDLPVDENTDHAVVNAGSSRLSLIQGDAFDGVHHLAFGILPSEFEQAHAWLSARVPLLVKNGQELFASSGGWDSRSVYFMGPDDIILEFIARDADANVKSDYKENPRILSISEIGIAVADVPAAVKMLSDELALPPFFDQDEIFAPLGNHDGLLILVQQDRIWFPTKSLRPARGPLCVSIESAIENTRLDVTSAISITTAHGRH